MKNTKVAVIGLGKIGEAIATNLVKGNHEVIVASRDLKKSSALATKLGSYAMAMETNEAIRAAEVVIPAIYFNSLKEFFQTYEKELTGKIVVDVSNPIGPDGQGGFKKIIAVNESSGEILAELLPKGASLIKAFGTLGVGSLVNDAFSERERKVLFYASSGNSKQQKIEELITCSGFDPLYVGGLNQSIRIEVFGDLHEFGGLGKTVSLTEAKNKL